MTILKIKLGQQFQPTFLSGADDFELGSSQVPQLTRVVATWLMPIDVQILSKNYSKSSSSINLKHALPQNFAKMAKCKHDAVNTSEMHWDTNCQQLLRRINLTPHKLLHCTSRFLLLPLLLLLLLLLLLRLLLLLLLLLLLQLPLHSLTSCLICCDTPVVVQEWVGPEHLHLACLLVVWCHT